MPGGPQEPRKKAPGPRRRLWSPAPALAGATLAGIGVLTSVYAAANHDLTGWHLLVAILFGGATLALVVEAFYRSQAHVPWTSVALIGALCAVVSLTFVALPSGHPATAPEARVEPVDGAPTGGGEVPATGGEGEPSAPTPGGGMSFSARPLERELFHLAFYRPIPSLSRRKRRQGCVGEVGSKSARATSGCCSATPAANRSPC